MGDEIFSVYLTPADYSKLAYAKLDLPASPWKLLDALDKVRLSEGDSLYLEITDYRDFEVLHSSLVCSATNLLELNDLAERLSRLNEVQRIAFEGLVRVDFQKQESITLKRLRDLTESVDCCHVVESVVSDGQLGRFYAENGFVPEVEGMSDGWNLQSPVQKCRSNIVQMNFVDSKKRKKLCWKPHKPWHRTKTAKRRTGLNPFLLFIAAACGTVDKFRLFVFSSQAGLPLPAVRTLLRQFRCVKQIVAVVTRANQINHLDMFSL